MIQVRLAAVCVLGGMMLAQGAIGQTAAPPRMGLAPQSAATATAPRLGLPGTPVVDRSSPDKTWAALCAAVKAGDLKAFRACCYNKNEVSTLFMNAYSDSVVTTFQLAHAAANLGTEGVALSKNLESSYTDLVKSGQDRKALLAGDSIKWVKTVTTKEVVAEEAMYFKKTGPEWLLDTEQTYNLNTAEGRKVAEDFVTSSGPTLKTLKAVIDDIQAKKITTVQQMRTRMAGK
jgi:hypothetical protein